jgi:ribose transport system substrate-binding protein
MSRSPISLSEEWVSVVSLVKGKVWRVGVALLVALALVSGCAKGGAGESSGSGADKSASSGNITIALSNSFIGNTWRQTMVKVFESAAQEAKSKGLIADFSVNNTSQNTATEQIAQIKALILKKPSAILVNSASPTALNPVIQQACDAGIVVITFDSVGSAPCEYDEAADLAQFGALGADGVLDAMGGQGNVIVVRGVVGSAPEKIIYDAQMAEIKKHPGVNVVAELQGEASNPVTQQAVQAALPSLPDVKGVITGGSTYGALQAFESAGRPLPFGNFSNDGTDLALWKKLKQQDPTFRAASVRPDPGQSALAMWMAIAILKGEDVPKTVTSPNLTITDETLDQWIAVTPESATAAWQWTQEEAMAGLKAQAAGQPMPEPAVPTSAP